MTARRLRRASAALFLTGSVLLLSSLLAPWYEVSGDPTNSPTFVERLAAFGVTATGPPGDFSSSYARAYLPSTGDLMQAIVTITIVSALLTTVAGLVAGLVRPDRGRRLVLTLALISVAASIASPAVMAGALPSALCTDARGFVPPLGVPVGSPSQGRTTCPWSFYQADGSWDSPGEPTGPGDSFQGHSALYNQSLTWGPGPAWFLVVIGAAVIAGGTVTLWVSGRPRAARSPPPAGRDVGPVEGSRRADPTRSE